MKRFNITVNGKAYDVAVEEITGSTAPVQNTAPAPNPVSSGTVSCGIPQKPKPVATTTPTPTPSASAVASSTIAEGTKVEAPMPGTIVDVKVNVGDSVSLGQPIVILEAMKMENDVVSPIDGKVTSITVKKGDSVGSGQVIATVQ